MRAIELPHRDPDCTGAWRLERGDTVLRCAACRVSYTATREAKEAALAELTLGHMLQDLTSEGLRGREDG